MKKAKVKVGIIGCGAIGSEIAFACEGRLRKKMHLVAICDKETSRAKALQAKLKGAVSIVDRSELIRKSDLVVEAAGASVSPDVVRECMRHNKDVLVMSVGGLLGSMRLLSAIRRARSKVYLPSGAICGLDGIKAASIGRIRSATLTTRKPPRSFEGAPYLEGKGLDVKALESETVLFEGTAREAVAAFPQNINVAAAVSLACAGKEVTVRIVASPGYARNVHTLEVEGDFGKITTRTENVPSEKNPKTSALAILSAIATLEGIADNVRLGT